VTVRETILCVDDEEGVLHALQQQLGARFGHECAIATASSGSDALELFDELERDLWAERAAAELARIPGRGRAAGGLTETERRVAELVAQGLSNKEVAAQLFVSVRAVEANLSRIYAKLGIRSRSELAARGNPA